MIFISVTINYLNQLIRTACPGVESILTELRVIGESFGATVGQRTNPILMSFSDTRPFDLLQASEGISHISRLLLTQAGRLRGASLVIHQADTLDEAQPVMQTARFTITSVFGAQVTREGISALKFFFDFTGSHDLASLEITTSASALGYADATKLSEKPLLSDHLEKMYSTMARAGTRAVFIDAGKSCRSIHSMESQLRSLGPEKKVITLSACRLEAEEFSPFTQAITDDLIDEILENTEPGNAELILELKPAFKLAAASRLSGKLPESVVRGSCDFINLLLDAMGTKGAILLCDAPERFSTEAIELIGRRLQSGRGLEQYLILSSMLPPRTWIGSWLEQSPLPILADRNTIPATADLVESALGPSKEYIRIGLRERFEALAVDVTAAFSKPGLSKVLSLLPEAARLYLYELILAENILTPDELASFSSRLGLLPRGEALLQAILKRAGLVDPTQSSLPYPPLDTSVVESIIGTKSRELLHTTFLSCLIDRYKTGSIRPSTLFLSRVGEKPQTASITFDCLFNDALNPDVLHPGDTSFLSSPSACILDFWRALTLGDAEAAKLACARAGETEAGPHGAIILALMRTELAYAEGDIDGTAQGARSALLAHSSDSPLKLEARAHRMMGLTALAAERYTDAADYLSNALELAESAGDHYEGLMSAYARAITEFMTGSLVRATLAADQAARSARNIFRMDGLAAVVSLKGRVDFELGDYDKAVQRYRELEELGKTYGLPQVPARARIWQGRALAYLQDFDLAETLLQAEAADSEARIFLGELEILRGQPGKARNYLTKPLPELLAEETPSPQGNRPFRPSDRFEWSSPLIEIEGRCIDFSAADAPLADLELALTLFASGLDELNASCAEGLHRLTRSKRAAKPNPGMGTYCFLCYLLEEKLPDPPVDKLTVLSRAFKVLQQRAGRIESRVQREKYMEKNTWNRRLLEAARIHKFI